MTVQGLKQTHESFNSALGAIDRVLRHNFRRLPKDHRDEANANTRAAVWSSWASLVERGKDPVTIGVTGIAERCCLYTKAGRKVGNQNRGRSCLDINDPRVRRDRGLRVVSIDDVATPHGASWREYLADSRGTTPADLAAFRIDLEEFFKTLPPRMRQMAELLVEGHETGVVARQLGVTPACVSVTRAALEARYWAYQGALGCEAPRAAGSRRNGRRGARGTCRRRAAPRAVATAS